MAENPYSAGQHGDSVGPEAQVPGLESSIRSLQIVAIGLVSGVLIFLGVVLVLTSGNLSGELGLLTTIGLGLGALMVVNHSVIPRFIAATQLKQASAQGLLQRIEVEQLSQCGVIYRSQAIIGLALLEGAAMLNLIVLLIEHHVGSLVVTVVLLGLMLAKFPTQDRVMYWCDSKLRELSRQ